MQRRFLGNGDVELSEVALGTWGLSGAYGPVSPNLFRQTIEAALEVGVTTFDAAPLWAGTEAMLGEVLEGNKDVEILTRAGVRQTDDAIVTSYAPDDLREDLDASCETLRREHIDVWTLHNPKAEDLANDDLWSLVRKLKAEGRIRAIAVGCDDIHVARAALAHDVDALCLPHNLMSGSLVEELQDEADALGCSFIARSPLFHGLLSGKWTEYRQFARDDHRFQRWSRHSLALRVRQVNRLRFLVREEVPNLAAAALRYVLGSPNVACAVLGARRPIQIRNADTLAGAPPYFGEDDLVRLQGILREIGVA